MSVHNSGIETSMVHGAGASGTQSQNLIQYIPVDKICEIFSYLNMKDLAGCALVCEQWTVITNDPFTWKSTIERFFFGPDKWSKYYGETGETPPLPEDMHKLLLSPCPFWSTPEKPVRVMDSHMLVLIPAAVNEEALTLNKLQDLIQNPQSEGYATDYKVYSNWTKGEHGSTPIERSHWVLMTRDVVPGSRNKTYQEQKDLVNQYGGYRLPGALEAAVCTLMEHVSSGSMLFGALTYTCCTEKVQDQHPVVVGGFGSDGLDVYIGFGSVRYGLGALRKF